MEIKNLIKFSSQNIEDFIATANLEVNAFNESMKDSTPVVHNFFPADNKVLVTISDEKRIELGRSSNILRTEKLSSYPLGFTHQHMTQYKEIIVGKNSLFESLEDAKNYSAAVVEANSTEKITIAKLVDYKFTNRTWYIISTNFSGSDYLEIEHIETADAEKGMTLAEQMNNKIVIKTDGVVI